MYGGDRFIYIYYDFTHNVFELEMKAQLNFETSAYGANVQPVIAELSSREKKISRLIVGVKYTNLLADSDSSPVALVVSTTSEAEELIKQRLRLAEQLQIPPVMFFSNGVKGICNGLYTSGLQRPHVAHYEFTLDTPAQLESIDVLVAGWESRPTDRCSLKGIIKVAERDMSKPDQQQILAKPTQKKRGRRALV